MSSSAGLHTQLAAVMESLVHAAVAELKKLLELSLEVRAGEETPLPAKLQADSRDKMVMFASVMESLGNEALWKIIHILEEARLLKPRKGLKKKKKKKKTRARHNTQIEVEHSYGMRLESSDSHGLTQTKLEEAGEAEEAGGREDDNLVVLAVTVKDEHEDIDISALDDRAEAAEPVTYTLQHKQEYEDQPLDRLDPEQEHQQLDQMDKEYQQKQEQDEQEDQQDQQDQEHQQRQEQDQKHRLDQQWEQEYQHQLDQQQVQEHQQLTQLDQQLQLQQVFLLPKFLILNHIATETSQQRFECPKCGKCFSKRKQLTRHALTHREEKPFVCSICSRAFGQRQSLKRHMRTHTGEKPYTCEVCGKTFNLLQSLHCHSRIHTGKLFVCGVCGKGFTRTITLKAHEVIHTGQKPFKCEQCSRTFRYAGNLKAHKRSTAATQLQKDLQPEDGQETCPRQQRAAHL
ncbi:hypothetical protein D5F01_LYC17047 [Larimichthys crocea]|uniref:C2H2-type domain-containing protein n=1 Tax=Larimichthys crocea TaxID=215358 RepID=A0A6G0HWT5_LARCR|nr:hypothetical protein D5F01_LYC17047 [Larimichthys crocea]